MDVQISITIWLVIGAFTIYPSRITNQAGSRIAEQLAVAGIAVFQSGLPFSMIDNPGNAVVSRANFNPSFTGHVQCNGDVSGCLNNYITQGAFVTSRPRLDGTSVGVVNNPTFDRAAPFGNTPRNFLTGPGQKNVDVSVIKFIPITERVRGEVRAEFFNVFNWVNYANPVNNIAIGSFGRIISASTGPRGSVCFKLNFWPAFRRSDADDVHDAGCARRKPG
jgi:hypothetical protein